MKRILVISCILLATCLPAAAEAEEVDLAPLLGTWVNPEYNPTRKSPKFVYRADQTLEGYSTTTATVPYNVYTYTVEEAWRDAEGAHWYKLVATKTQTLEERFWYLLIRIGPDGSIYEEDYIRGNLKEFVTALDPESYFYKILYRE